MEVLNYKDDPRAVLIHFNPYHDPKTGEFTTKSSSGKIVKLDYYQQDHAHKEAEKRTESRLEKAGVYNDRPSESLEKWHRRTEKEFKKVYPEEYQKVIDDIASGKLVIKSPLEAKEKGNIFVKAALSSIGTIGALALVTKIMHSDYQDYLAHFNPNHDPRNGQFMRKSGGSYIADTNKETYKKTWRDNTINNKKHFDKTIKKGEIVSTLSYDPDRTKNAEMFYAAYKALDKMQYAGLFNKTLKQPVMKDGVQVGTEKVLKYRINQKATSDIKVASEDSATKVFMDLYKNDPDFYNFLMDDDRLEKHFEKNIRTHFKGYREALTNLRKMDDKSYIPSEKEAKSIYRLFNYIIPAEGDNVKDSADIKRQRSKFFSKMKEQGYSAILDTNDAIYGGFKAEAPVIVFDTTALIPKDVYRTKASDKRLGQLSVGVRRILGI